MPQRHALTITAAADDIDELGHVSNLVYLRWVLDAALAHSAAAGWDHAAYRRLGAVFVVRRHEIDYLAPVVAGDEVVVDDLGRRLEAGVVRAPDRAGPGRRRRGRRPGRDDLGVHRPGRRPPAPHPRGAAGGVRRAA